MTYVAVPASELPKRQRRGKEFDSESANALLALVSVEGQTASDGQSYDEIGKARSAAGKARRLLMRVAPDAELVKSRVYGSGDDGNAAPFRWVVYLATEKPAKGKGKGKGK